MFQCELDGGEVLEVELAVAPDIAVTLSPPTSLRKRTGKRTGGKRHQVVQSRSESEPAAGELEAPAQAQPLERSSPEPIPARHSFGYRRSGSVRRVESEWLRRSLALIVLLATVIALAIVLHSP